MSANGNLTFLDFLQAFSRESTGSRWPLFEDGCRRCGGHTTELDRSNMTAHVFIHVRHQARRRDISNEEETTGPLTPIPDARKR